MNEKIVGRDGRCGALRAAAVVAVFAVAAAWSEAGAQLVKAPRYQGTDAVNAPVPQLNLPPLPPAKTPNGTVVEDVVVRVNDQIISRSDVERSEGQLETEAQQQNLPAGELAARQKDMLRDMIDQQLLLSKAKELGLNADADVIRRLDEIRKQNKLESLEDLEKAARQQGVSFEDFKAQIRDQILTQQVVRDEVGRRLQVTPTEEAKYYSEHAKEFEQPEQVRLSEILVPLPDTATPAEIVQAERKANDLKSQVTAGASFADVAKKNSGGPTAAQGGDLGLFKRGALAKVLEDATFDLKAGESTQPIRTRQGFVVLEVTQHVQAGPAPLKDVEPQVQEAMYIQQMQPALRAYLTKLREEAYVDIEPGFVDSGASGKESKPVFTAYAPPAVKKKKAKDKARFDRRGYQTVSAKKTPAVIASPDTTGSRTITGPEAGPAIDSKTGLAAMDAPAKPVKAGKPGKKVKEAKKEKVRFGQAPRTSLPPATSEDASATPVAAVGTAAAGGGTDSVTGDASTAGTTALASTSAGVGNPDVNPLDPVAPVQKKTRFAARAVENKQKKVATVNAKQREKTAATPDPMTPEERASAQTQAAPLGLSGDTGPKKKAKKVKPPKGEKKVKQPKTRLEDQKKAAPAPAPEIAPTASPALAPTATTGTGREKTPASAPARQAPVPDSTAPPASTPGTTVPPTTPPAPAAPQTPPTN